MKKIFLSELRNTFNHFKVKNLVPGALVYKGKSIDDFSIDVFEYNDVYVKHNTFNKASEFILEETKAGKSDFIKWINITGLSHVEEIKKVSNYFNISNLIMEQVLNISNHSTNSYSKEYIFNDIQMVYGNRLQGIVNENISIFKFKNIVIIFQEKKGDVFDSVRNRIINKEGNIRNQGVNYLYFCLIDVIIDYYIGVLEIMRQQIELLEEQIMSMKKVDINIIHGLRKQLMILKFSATPIEKMVSVLIEKDEILPLDNKQYLLNLKVHIKEVVNDLSLQKDYIDAMFENYVLNNSNDMNRIMTTLTIFSAIFIPLSFAAGVFGMNFDYIPGLSNSLGFSYFIAGCGLMAVAMLMILKMKKWF